MIDPLFDGVDHVNIYLKGRTSLGRMLSNLYSCNIIIPDAGTFRTLEGYWYWLSVPDPRLRELNGFAAKALGRELKRLNHFTEIKDFEEKIREAIWYKLIQNPDIRIALTKSDLPLKHYYVYGNSIKPNVVELPKFDWLVGIFEEFRRYFKVHLL